MNTTKFLSDIIDQINDVANMDIESRPKFQSKDLIFDNLKLHLHHDVIYFGMVTLQSYNEDKAQKLLLEVRDLVNTMYKNNMTKIL